jgi:NhaP-type Na+/H+ or K+/H+ antiporter
LLDWRAIVFILALMFVVRPLIVPATLIGTKLKWNETAFISAVAPRGVVAAATAGHLSALLVENGREDAAMIAPLVFATVFVTVFGYGFLVAPLSRLLGLVDRRCQSLDARACRCAQIDGRSVYDRRF